MLHVRRREQTHTKRNADMTEPELNSQWEVIRKMKSECWVQADPVQSQRGVQLTLERETSLGKKALTMVRRAALQNLLEKEQQQYSIELGQIGKAFYKQRI